MITNFKIFENERGLMYKDGEIVVLDHNRLINHYKGETPEKYLKSISKFQIIHIGDTKSHWPYYIKNDSIFYIQENEILRKATEDEVSYFYMMNDINKFNL